jgi:hypothetical protein
MRDALRRLLVKGPTRRLPIIDSDVLLLCDYVRPMPDATARVLG